MTIKTKQLLRTSIQLVSLGLTAIGFFINFQWTMAIILGLMLLGGTYYCGFVCPYGTIQEFMAKLGRLLGIKKQQLPKGVHKYLKYTRYIILLLFTLVTSGILLNILSFDPRTNFTMFLMGNTPSIIAMISIVAFALLSLRYERFFCSYLCIEGAKYGLISMARPFTIVRNESNCINCKKCDKICPMQIEISKSKTLRSPNCINCFKCEDACPVDDTLEYKLIKFSKKTILVYGLVVTLVAFGLVFGLDDEHESLPLESQTTVVELESHESSQTSTESSSQVDQSTIQNESLYKDGVYTGTGRGFKSNISVEVTIENGVISNIQVTQQNDDRKWYNRAYDGVVSSIYEEQSADVNTVSGATYSSIGIRDAVAQALEKAK